MSKQSILYIYYKILVYTKTSLCYSFFFDVFNYLFISFSNYYNFGSTLSSIANIKSFLNSFSPIKSSGLKFSCNSY